MTTLRLPGAALILFVACAAGPVLCAEGADKDTFPPEQIQQLVAPIALYPDALIAQMLMASTYPLDIVQANRWLGDHQGLEGDALQQAVDQQDWDESVKALVFFPSVLGFMSDNLDWTQDLGDAVLAQQGDVTDAIQRLRAEADQTGALASNEQQKVEKDGDTIIIQPAQPEVVYVPSYDPVTAYGDSAPPPTTYYPDAYADASASYAAGGVTTSYVPSGQVVPVGSGIGTTDSLVSFGVGALAGGLLTAAIMWNDNDRYDRIYYGGRGYYGAPSYWSQPNYWNNNGWRQPNNIQVNRNVQRGDVNINRGIVGSDIDRNRVTKWEHNPVHRGGVRYRDASTQNRFSSRRTDRTIDRDVARGRLPTKAPDLSRVKREGAASGGMARLAGGPDKGGIGGSLKDRGADRRIQAPKPADRGKGTGQARTKVKARPKPATKPAGATRRPVNKQAKRPDLSKAKAKRPAKASAPKAQRPARTQAKSRAFQPSKANVSRQASHRGGASRARASRGGGAGRGGGGGGRLGRH